MDTQASHVSITTHYEILERRKVVVQQRMLVVMEAENLIDEEMEVCKKIWLETNSCLCGLLGVPCEHIRTPMYGRIDQEV